MNTNNMDMLTESEGPIASNGNRNEQECDGTFDFMEGDFTILAEGEKVHVMKGILCLASPVFNRMFQSGFIESGKEELTLPGKDIEDVKEFLRCIYPNILKPITAVNALQVLPLIEEYQVLHLKTRCEDVLLDSVNAEIPTEVLFQLLNEADLYNLDELRLNCILLASEKSVEILNEARVNFEPPPKALSEIFEKINAKLLAKVTALEESNKKLTGEVDALKANENLMQTVKTLKASNNKVSEEFEVMLEYMASDMRRARDWHFDGKPKWRDVQTVLLVNVKERYRKSIRKEIWGLPLQISTSLVKKTETFSTTHFKYDVLRIEFRNISGKSIFCEVHVKCFLVNRQPNGENVCFSKEGKFGIWRQAVEIDLKKTCHLEAVDEGFVRDGKICLIVYMYMTEPNMK